MRYLALEDDYRRLQERFYHMFGTEGADRLFFSVTAGNLENGLDEQLKEFMRDHAGTRLVIIGVLQIKRAFDVQIILAGKESMIDFPSHCRNTVSHSIRN